MTDIHSIEAGTDLDYLIALEIPWDHCNVVRTPDGDEYLENRRTGKIESIPEFSTDWRHAMFAADSTCLFCADDEFDSVAVSQIFIDGQGEWRVLGFTVDPLTIDVISRGATGPLTICRAIIALSEREKA